MVEFAPTGARGDAHPAVSDIPPPSRPVGNVVWSSWSSARSRSVRRSAISIVAIFLIWEFLGRFVITNNLFFAPFSAVVVAGLHTWSTGELQANVVASFGAVFYGMLLAIVAGISLGIVSGVSRTFNDYTELLFTGLYSTPLVAIAPILILWFGIGVASKVAVVFLMALFPILISTSAGIRNCDKQYLEVAQSFGASRIQIIRKVRTPAALPFIITGIRLAIGRAIVGVVVGELFGARAGLGFMIFTAGQTFDVPQLFLGVLLLAIAGILLTGVMKLIEQRFARWKPVEIDA